MGKTRFILLLSLRKVKSGAPEIAVCLFSSREELFLSSWNILFVYEDSLRNWAQSALLLVVNCVHNKKLYFCKSFLIPDLSLYDVCLIFWLTSFAILQAIMEKNNLHKKGKVIGKLWKKKELWTNMFVYSSAVLAWWCLHQSPSLFIFK